MAATPNNNFNILPWYTSLEKLNSKKWYAFGQTWPLICPNDSILPFQFVVPGVITSVSTITLITPDNIVTNTSVQPVIIANEKAGYSVIMVHPGITSLGTTLKIGQYRAQLVIGLDTFYSEMFTVVDNISDYIKLTYWNDENLYYNGGEVNYSNNFKYTMYICSTIGKPEYEFEEELTKRAGYKFLESQTSNKIYKFNFVAPEFICDAMRLIRLSDYIKLEYDGDSYNALSFSYEPKWETQGDLASVDVEFDTDAIIQKLVSFNRRQKEGFYNALLTNIDEPLLFDVNTVALYYDEYRAKAAAEIRDGKMIRDLSEISLVNENTLIVVDTGSGPAYKMSLYRLMEKFMRRDKDETTEFDFWIKGDAKFGRDNYDNPTASISRDGLFRTVSAIIYDYLSSEKFISGFAGEGFKIYKDEFGNWRIECDILDVRKVMNVFELIIQKIRSVNGALVISQANGKVSAVTESPDLQSWILEFEDKDETFQAHDLVRCQVFDRRTKQAPAFDFTKFASYLYDGTQIDDSVSITNMGVEFNLNNSANSGFQLYLRPAGHSEQTPITTKECILEVSGLYEGMTAIWNALDKEEIGMEGIGGFLVNGENTIRAITEADNAYNLGIMVIADAGHGDGKVTIKQKVEDTASKKGKYYWCEVASVNGNLVTIPKSEFEGIMPAVGDEVVQMGNTENPLRQSLIYMSAAEDGKPKIELVGGVKTKSLTGTSRSVFGNLDHITDPSFPDNMQPHGEGVYTDNGYFKGAFVFFNGKNAQTEIEKAQTDASNAQAEAEAAKERLNKWASDGFISPSEKQQLLLEKRTITAEKSEINADANRYNVNTVSYNAAYEAYISQINQHTAAEPENIPVGPNLIPCQIDYYNNRTLILNEIAKAVKAKTDYLETEMSAIPGKIELAVRSLKIADTNLLKGAFREITNASYNIGYYNYDVPVINGKEYTLTVCYTLSSENTHISAYSNEGTNFLVDFNTKGNMVVESKKVTMVGYKPTAGLYFFQFPNGTYGSKVHWAVLADGNLGVTSWIPSASEKNVGLRNLCSFKRITDAGFTYAQNYEDDGSFYVSPGKLNEETNVANKDMFGLTYDPQKQYYIFIDSAIRSDTNLDKSSTFFIIKYTDGTERRVCIVYPNKIDYNYIITQKPISKIVGSYGNIYGSTLRIGVYETNFPVSWSPAPEDVAYSYKKYTDAAIEVTEGKIDISVKTQIEKLNIGSSNILNGSADYWFSESDHPSNVTLDSVSKSVHRCLVRGQGAFNCYKRWMPVDKDRVTAGKQYTVGIDVSMQGNYYHGADFWFNIRRQGTHGQIIANGIVACEIKSVWTRYYVTVTIPQGENLSDLFFMCGFTGNNATTNPGLQIWYKNINLVEGSVGSSWAPSAGDIFGESVKYTTSQIEVIEEQIKLKVDSTVVDALGQTVKQQGSQILLNTQKIEQTVTKTEYAGGLSRAEAIARYVSTGKMLPEHSDVTFKSGLNGLSRYNNSGTEGVTLHRSTGPAIPNDSGYMAVITCRDSLGTSPGAGGFYFGNMSRANAVFLYKIVAMIPGGKRLDFATNPTGDGAVTEWLTGQHGTGKWEEYYCLRKCGDKGTFSSTGFFNVAEPGTFEWYLAYATCYDIYGDNSQITKTVYQTKITQLEESISLKATKTEVTNSINSLSGRLSEAEIKLQPNNIALTVKEQGIGYSGTNYFGWGGNMTRSITGANVFITENKGTYGLQIACANTSATILARYQGLGMNFKGPGKYTLSFKAKQQAGVAMDLNVNVCDAEDFIITPPTTWQYYKKTFTVTQYTDAPHYGFIDFERSGGNTTQIIEFAEIMLEYGSEATQWRPAPFDTTAASGLLATGINISNGQIVLTADKTKFQNNSGSQIAVFDSNGINADLINAKKLSTAVAGKRIVIDPAAQEVQLYNENGNKVASIGFKQDDRISIPYIQLKDYSYTGSVLRAFDIYGGTLYSNETRYGANYGYTLSPTTGLQFTKNGSVTKSYPAQ
ncbi:tail fiber protein [Bacteroides phage BF503P2]|nr:tail fiber protein [Bacteroides phage BF503P2]